MHFWKYILKVHFEVISWIFIKVLFLLPFLLATRTMAPAGLVALVPESCVWWTSGVETAWFVMWQYKPLAELVRWWIPCVLHWISSCFMSFICEYYYLLFLLVVLVKSGLLCIVMVEISRALPLFPESQPLLLSPKYGSVSLPSQVKALICLYLIPEVRFKVVVQQFIHPLLLPRLHLQSWHILKSQTFHYTLV